MLRLSENAPKKTYDSLRSIHGPFGSPEYNTVERKQCSTIQRVAIFLFSVMVTLYRGGGTRWWWSPLKGLTLCEDHDYLFYPDALYVADGWCYGFGGGTLRFLFCSADQNPSTKRLPLLVCGVEFFFFFFRFRDKHGIMGLFATPRSHDI